MASRRTNLELILSTHDQNCLSCVRSTDCELQKLCRDYGVDGHRFTGDKGHYDIDDSAPHDSRQQQVHSVPPLCGGLQSSTRPWASSAPPSAALPPTSPAPSKRLWATAPAYPAASASRCAPTGALTGRTAPPRCKALHGPKQTCGGGAAAPSVRATLGECFGMPVGTNVEGKMVAALRRLGFDGVFDTDTGGGLHHHGRGHRVCASGPERRRAAADHQLQPGWVKFCETYYPDMIPNLSSCKSPSRCSAH